MIETIWWRNFVELYRNPIREIFKYVIKTKNKLSSIYLLETIKG